MQLIGVNTLFPSGTQIAQDGTVSTGRLCFRPCPSMDLIACFPKFVGSSNKAAKNGTFQDGGFDAYEDKDVNVDVYRFNGQKVFSVGLDTEEGTVGITDAGWRTDGIVLAILSSDGTVRLVNSFSGKVVHTFSSKSGTTAGTESSRNRSSPGSASNGGGELYSPTLLAYTVHFSEPQIVRRQLAKDTTAQDITLDDLLGLDSARDQLLKLKADLPNELANLDAEAYLPRLSTLPTNGITGDDVFSSRASIDTIFHTVRAHSQGSYIDALLVAKDNGYVHLRIFDAFEVGEIDLNTAIGLPTGGVIGGIIQMVSHPLSEQIYIIAHNKGTVAGAGNDVLHVLRLDLRFVQHTMQTLPMLANKATQLYHLVRYLRQIENVLSRQIKEAFDLPNRFLRNLNEDLVEQDGEGSTFETTAYHSILTGEVTGKYKEWLSEILGARGVERWRKAIHECLELVRNLVHDSWNPAIERASVVVSRLTGLATADSTFGIEKQVLRELCDTLDVMSVLTEDLLREVNAEILDFSAFIRWLKCEVEASSLEETSEKLEEMRDTCDSTDVRKVMRYISNGLRSTVAKKYFNPLSNAGGKDVAEDATGLYEQVKEARLAGKLELPVHSMLRVTSRLAHNCDKLFEQVAHRLRQSIMVEHVAQVRGASQIDTSIASSRVLDDGNGEECVGKRLIVVSRSKQQHSAVRLLDITLTSSGLAKEKYYETTPHDVVAKCTVKDIQFVDDEEVLVLAESPSGEHILAADVQSLETWSVRHSVQANDEFVQAGFRAHSIQVNGRKNRRTVMVIDGDGRGYAVYDVDSAGETGGSRSEDAMEE